MKKIHALAWIFYSEINSPISIKFKKYLLWEEVLSPSKDHLAKTSQLYVHAIKRAMLFPYNTLWLIIAFY
ncbi:hypothetical protein CKK19_15140 [Enterobacter sp. CCUG 70166]|nr:hypothetical protein [Enterobacter sp. CCUG 70166]